MRNEEHYGYLGQCLAKLSLLPEEKALPQRAAFEAAVAAEDKALENVPTNMTESLVEADRIRDDCWNGLHMFADAMLLFPKVEAKEAAKRIKAILATYGDPRRLPYLQENGAIDNLITDLQTEKATADLVLIHAADWLTELKKYETQFLTLFGERNAQNAIQENGAVKKARKASDVAYGQLIQVVNALVLIDGENAYLPFINEMNELIAYQRIVFSRRKATAEKKPKE